MIDKSLIKKRFSKSMKTYNDNAIVQKYMAKKLISLLPRMEFNSVFEIGTSTGVLTEQIAKNIKFNNYSANDLVETSKQYIDKIIPENIFIPGDIENINIIKKYDLIISNAALQWCDNPSLIIKKLQSCLNKNGVLAASIFANDNLKEIKTVLNLKNYHTTNIKGIEETYTLYFDNPIDVLKHIKLTGANAIEEYKFTKSSLKNFVNRYIELFSYNNKVSLTYNPLYIILC